MLITINPRRAGKTTRAVAWLDNNPHGILIVFSEQEAKRIAYQFKLDEATANRIMSWEQYRASKNFHNKEVFIDNADIVLQSMVDNSVVEITMTGTHKTAGIGVGFDPQYTSKDDPKLHKELNKVLGVE